MILSLWKDEHRDSLNYFGSTCEYCGHHIPLFLIGSDWRIFQAQGKAREQALSKHHEPASQPARLRHETVAQHQDVLHRGAGCLGRQVRQA